MKACSVYIVACVGIMLSCSAALAQSASDTYYPAYNRYWYPPWIVIPDPNLFVPATPLTQGETRALNSKAAHDGDITTNPGVKARIDRDITTQPGKKDPSDRDITKKSR
jgi:hypothetical protein